MTPEYVKTTALLALSIQDVMVARNLKYDVGDRDSIRLDTIATIRKRLIKHMRQLGVTGRGQLPLSTRQHVGRILDVTRPGWGHGHSEGEVLQFVAAACENALAPRQGATDSQKRTWEEQIAGRQRLLQIALENEQSGLATR